MPFQDDRSDFAPARFYTLKLDLDRANAEALRIKQVAIESVTTIMGEDGKPLSKGTIDPEGIALSPLETVFISSEGITKDGIPPFVREFDLKQGNGSAASRFPNATALRQQMTSCRRVCKTIWGLSP
jgi:hypothetical protein